MALYHDVARFHEALDAARSGPSRAISPSCCSSPTTASAMTRLEELFRRQERWDDLASLLEKRTTGALTCCPRASIRRKRMQELADLYDHRLERPYEAIDTYERFVDSADEDERGADHPEVVREACDGAGGAGPAVRPPGHVAQGGQRPRAADRARPRAGRPADPALAHRRDEGAGAGPAGRGHLGLRGDPGDRARTTRRRWPPWIACWTPRARYEPLQEILRRRAEQARGSEKVELIRRRARILEERLGNADAAAACLRALGPEAVRDEETAAALLRNLGRAGLAHEALRLLDQRIEYLVNDGAPVDKVAALQLEAAALRLDRLDDVDGARRSIEAALALHPENPGALGALARLHLRRNDFAAYAKARAREAEARSQRTRGGRSLAGGRAGAARSAGQARPRRAAASSGPRVADPTNASALRGLAALLTAEGQLGEARAALEKQLELMEEPDRQGGGADRPGPQPVGKAGRRRGGHRPAGRGAGAGPRLPAGGGHHGRRLLPGAAVGRGGAAAAAGGAAHEGPARRRWPSSTTAWARSTRSWAASTRATGSCRRPSG